VQLCELRSRDLDEEAEVVVESPVLEESTTISVETATILLETSELLPVSLHEHS
jgi:hypothetical protein